MLPRLRRVLVAGLLVLGPLLVLGLLVVRWEQGQRAQEAEAAASRSARSVAKLVDATLGAAATQLDGLAAAPSITGALRTGASDELSDELALFNFNPAWAGVAVVDQQGDVQGAAGSIPPDLVARPRAPRDVLLLPRTAVDPPRAVMVTEVVDRGRPMGTVIGLYALRDLEQAVAGSGAGSSIVLVTAPDGQVLLGPLDLVGDRLELLSDGGKVEARIADRAQPAAVEPALGGNVRIVALQAPSNLGELARPSLLWVGAAALLFLGFLGAWGVRLSRAEQRAQVHERELLALHELAIDATVNPNREQMIRGASARAAELVSGVERAFVALSVPGEDRVVLHRTYPDPAREPIELAYTDNHLLARALQHGRRECGTWDPPPTWREAGFSGGWECWTPLVAHGRILGAICVCRRKAADFLDPEQARLLDAVAATLAVSLESHERLAELAHQRTMLATVIDGSPDGLLALDANQRILVDNTSARHLVRADRPLVGMRLDEMIDEVERRGGRFEFDFEPSELLGRSRAGATTRGSMRLKFDGDVKRLESLMAPLELPGGAVGNMVSLRDVSERAELAQVRRLNERVSSLARQAASRAAVLEQLLAASDLGTAFLDTDDRLVYVNRLFSELLAIPPLHPGLARRELEEQLSRRVDGFTGLENGGILATRGRHRRYLALRSVRVRGDDEKPVGCLVSLRDETAQRELDEARESLIGIAAHEFKNPLAVLRLQAEIGLRDPARAPEALERIRARTRELQVLVDRLLDVTKAELGKLNLECTEVLLSPLVKELVDPLRAQGADIDLRVEEEAVAWADPIRVEQVVTNLLTNAIRYAPGSPIEVTVTRDDGEVRITVADHGPGIPKSEQTAIFERFGQGRIAQRGPGLGIGLYLSRRIAEAHGGSIELESEPGEGSRFSLVLPAARPRRTPPPREEGYSGAAQLST